MRIELQDQPAYAVKVVLGPDDTFLIKDKSLMCASNLDEMLVEPTQGGMTRLTSRRTSNELWLAGPLPGRVQVLQLEKQSVVVDQDVLLGLQQGLQAEPAADNLRTPQRTWLNVSGSGTLLLSTFGAIYPLQVDSEYVVNAAYIAAYSQTLRYQEIPLGPKDDQQDLVPMNYTFIGKGFIWCQTHHPDTFGGLLSPYLQHDA